MLPETLFPMPAPLDFEFTWIILYQYTQTNVKK